MRLTKKEVQRLTSALRLSMTSRDLSPGSLVTLASWCKNSGRLAHVISRDSWDPSSCKIQYLDSDGLHEPPVTALARNLILLEAR